MPSSTFAPRDPLLRRLVALATDTCEKCGLTRNAPAGSMPDNPASWVRGLFNRRPPGAESRDAAQSPGRHAAPPVSPGCESAQLEATELIRAHLTDPGSTWAIGTFGAIAEFHRTPSEPVTMDALSVLTARGGIRLNAGTGARAVAWERPTGGDCWTQGLAFCLDAAAGQMHRRTAVTELGPDAWALAAEDREGVLFDLGIAAPHCDACVRTADPALLRRLRAAAGQPLDAARMREIVAASPTRVFVSKLGRIEVRTPIPPADGKTPEGPHTHVLPDLLKLRRTHPATVPLPPQTVPAAELFPSSALRDPHAHALRFDGARHDAFQVLFSRYGQPACIAAKAATVAAVRAARAPDDTPGYTRAQRLARRVALRQLWYTDGPSAVLSAWRREFDRED